MGARVPPPKHMGGVVGIAGSSAAAAEVAAGLHLLQHRGQASAGVAALEGQCLRAHRGVGLVAEVFAGQGPSLAGSCAIGHVHYTSSDDSRKVVEMQPLDTSAPCELMLAHNGNLPDCATLRGELKANRRRQLGSTSDTEVILHVLADEFDRQGSSAPDEEAVFSAIASLHKRCCGSYAITALVAGLGLVAFRDPYGIRPLALGSATNPSGPCRIVASESAAICNLGYRFERDIEPGEAVVVRADGRISCRQCATQPELRPCLFEYICFARPDSTINGAQVNRVRREMGRRLALRIRRDYPALEQVDAVVAVPDSNCPCALELAQQLALPYREGLVRNNYPGRNFLNPSDSGRPASVHHKFSVIADELVGRELLIVDSSIVRGTTSREIITMVREAGARKVHFVSAAPPVRYSNIYGLDLPARSQLAAANRQDSEIAAFIGADSVVYQELAELEAAVRTAAPHLQNFEASCFNGNYVAGDASDPDPGATLGPRRRSTARARDQLPLGFNCGSA